MLVQQEGLSEGLLHQPLSQPVHADLVYGNILAPLDGGPLVVIDFEDALISWHPPFYDLALVIERFVLVAEPDDGRASELAGALLRGYGSVSAAGLRSGLPLRAMLELLSLRALLMLSDIEAAGGMVAPREWEKFFGLHDLAVARTALLARLDAMRNG